MNKNYSLKSLSILILACLVFFAVSCKKDSKNNGGNNVVTPVATPTKIGFYAAEQEVVDTAIYRVFLEPITQIGTQAINYDLVFDTGSGGLVIDAEGVIPPAMITKTGFNFTTDSVVVNGITITNQTNMIEYGDDNATTDKVYGNLAYANVKIGDQNGNITIKRLPFFLYYKAVDSKGNEFAAHEFDVFGVAPEYDITFANNAYITSPFSYFDPGNGLIKGFKIDAVPSANFSNQGTWVSAVTLGLTADDLNSGGYSFTQLSFTQGEGYLPILSGTLNYGGKNIATKMLFDSGTEPYSYLEDNTATNTSAVLLPSNTPVSVSTTSGFNYSFTTLAIDNLAYVENPKYSGSDISVLSLDFFLNNSYLIDFTDNKLGLKSN